jgi:hypothetical protein
MISQEQSLFDFDPKKEKIPRQITNIVPTRDLYPEIHKEQLSKTIIDAAEKENRRIRFEIEGVQGLIESKEDALKVAASLARYRFSVNNAYISDIGSGLYTMLTTNAAGLYDWRALTDSKTGKAVSARITISIETLYKAAFGPLVNDRGRALDGAGDIVQEAKDKINPIIDGLVAMPRAYASIHKKRAEDGSIIEAIIEGEPIHVYRKMSGARDALIIDLDYFFFPAIEKNDGTLKTNDQFLHMVAGLTSFLQLGRLLEGREKRPGESLPEVLTARRILLSAQAGYELRYFSPFIAKENASGRMNIALRRGSVADLYPAAVDKRPDGQRRYRFGEFSKAVACSGRYFRAAMKATGIEDALIKNGKVIVPATEKGAEFPEMKPNIVYIKADRLTK